jgi:hypothetical protein
MKILLSRYDNKYLLNSWKNKFSRWIVFYQDLISILTYRTTWEPKTRKSRFRIVFLMDELCLPFFKLVHNITKWTNVIFAIHFLVQWLCQLITQHIISISHLERHCMGYIVPFSETKGHTAIKSWAQNAKSLFVCLSYPIRLQHFLNQRKLLIVIRKWLTEGSLRSRNPNLRLVF